MTPQDVLAQPFTLPNGAVIKNRICKSAMSETLGDSAGAPTAQLAHLYQAWADGGIDLIEISGGTYEAPAMTGVKTRDEPVKPSTRQRESCFLAFAEKARKIVKTPLVVTGGFRTAAGMAQAIRSGAVDMVGLARALAMEPDLPNRLLEGKEPAYQVKPITTVIRAIDKMGILEINWYTGQLKRIGNGQPPKPSEPGLWVIAKLAWHMAFIGKKRLPTKLRAG